MSLPPVALVAVALASHPAPTHGGPCTAQIAQLERQIRHATGNPLEGPTAPQTLGAQLNRQPTPRTVERAEHQADARFDSMLDRARTANANDEATACLQALNQAKDDYGV